MLAGEKVATAGHWRTDYVDEGELLDTVGERQVLLGQADEPVALIEITRVERIPFVEVPWEFAQAEGEGFESIQHWRDLHRRFYAEQGVEIADDDPMVCVWFDVVADALPE